MGVKGNVTIYDLAESLGVSVGTIYRALHNKGRVAEKTRQRVLEMAEKTGFQYSESARALKRGPTHIGVIVCCLVPQYLNEIVAGMQNAFDALASLNVIAHMHLYARDIEAHRQEILDVMEQCIANQYSGVVLSLPYGSSEPYLEMIARMREAGIAIATIISDIPESKRILAVSPNGHCAGRLAAELLHLVCPDRRIAILTTNRTIDIHRSYLEGVMSYQDPLPFSSVDIMEHNDDPELLYEQLAQISARGDEYGGAYITSANSVAVYNYIQKYSLPPQLKLIITDLLPESRELLWRRVAFAAIFQDPFRQGNVVIHRLYRYLTDGTGGGIELITPQAVFRSNMNIQNESNGIVLHQEGRTL